MQEDKQIGQKVGYSNIYEGEKSQLFHSEINQTLAHENAFLLPLAET